MTPSDDRLSEHELDQFARLYASDDDSAATSSAEPHVIFRLGGERFAIALDDLDEVASVEGGIALPHVTAQVLGLSNVRGELLLLLDTAALLGLATQYRLDSNNRTLVIRDKAEHRVGLPVDAIEAVEDIDLADFSLHNRGQSASPVRRSALGEHRGGALSLLDVSDLRAGRIGEGA